MKRKKLAALICCLLLVQLAALPVQAAGPVYFTAINDNVLPLTDEGMPFWSGGYLYVDSGIFTIADNTPGELLGIYRSLNTARQLLVLSAAGRSLVFDMAAGTVKDNEGTSYYPAGIQRGGKVFVPVSLVAYFFGVSYSSTRVDWEGSYHGYLVRIRNGKAQISSDKSFADAATYVMEARYTEYLKSQEPEETPESSTPEEGKTEPVPDGKRVYLCLRAADAAATEKLLDVLDRFGSQAVFYCTPAFLEEQGGLLRRMSAKGHGIGLIADAADPEQSVVEQLSQGNEALALATCGKTRMAFLENSAEQAAAEAENAGYCVLEPDLDRSAYELKSASAANALLQRVTGRRGAVSVWLGDGADKTGLQAFLTAADQAEDHCLALTETGT